MNLILDHWGLNQSSRAHLPIRSGKHLYTLFYDDNGKEWSMLGLAFKAQWKDFDGKFGGIKGKVHQHVEGLGKWRSHRRRRAVQEGVEDLADYMEQDHTQETGADGRE